MLTYQFCKTVIENGNYGSYEEMMMKLDVFLLNNRITQAQYTELVALLNAKESGGLISEPTDPNTETA